MSTADSAAAPPQRGALLLSTAFDSSHGAAVREILGGDAVIRLQPTGKNAPPDSRVTAQDITMAYLSLDALHDAGFAQTLLALPALQWVHLCIAGADLPLAMRLRELGVMLTTSSGANAKAVAHSALAGLLALGRRFPRFTRQQYESRWQQLGRDEVPRDIDGTTATIIGAGPIGQEIARLCQAIGMRTIGVRRTADALPHFDEIIATRDLREVLPRTDWLIIACPLTAKTRHLIDRSCLALLPPHACLINISRGAVVVEADLIAALRAGTLAGAYCDVFETEPLASDSPLWQLPNVIVTPHNAGSSQGFAHNAAGYFLDNLRRWTQRQTLVNVVEGTAP